MSSLQGFCACMHGRDLCDFMDMGSGLQGLCTCMHVEYRYCFCHSLIVYCVYHHDTSNMAVLLGSHGVYQAWKANNVDMHHAWHNMVSHGSSSLTDYWCVCVRYCKHSHTMWDQRWMSLHAHCYNDILYWVHV